MKLHMSKDWLRKFEDNDIEEPGGVMACSPFLYSWMQASHYSDVSSVVDQVIELSLLNFRERHKGDNDDKFIWMMNRTIRHGKRQIQRAKMRM